MTMLELIETLNGISHYTMVRFCVESHLFTQTPHSEQCENKTFYDADDVIAFLFDKDLFGWKVESWNFTTKSLSPMDVDIRIYKFN